jgi:hypothetical protein
MTVTVFRAAEDLQRKILAPAGAITTLVAQASSNAPIIRVMVEPMYWHSIVEVPKDFKGYPVTVEKKEIAGPLQR